MLQLLQAGVREDYRSLTTATTSSSSSSSSLSPSTTLARNHSKISTDRTSTANGGITHGFYDIDNDNEEGEEEEDGLEGDFDWAVGPEPESGEKSGLAAQDPGLGLGLAAQDPGLVDEVPGIRLNNVWHDQRVQGDFSLWKTGPRLMMPSVNTRTPTLASTSTTTTTTTTQSAQLSQNIASGGASAGAGTTATATGSATTSSSIYTYYTGLKDRLGDTNLGQAACSNTPLGAITYQVSHSQSLCSNTPLGAITYQISHSVTHSVPTHP